MIVQASCVVFGFQGILTNGNKQKIGKIGFKGNEADLQCSVRPSDMITFFLWFGHRFSRSRSSPVYSPLGYVFSDYKSLFNRALCSHCFYFSKSNLKVYSDKF